MKNIGIPTLSALILVMFFSCKPSGGPVRIEASFPQAAGDTFYISEVFTEFVSLLDSVVADEEGKFSWKHKADLPSFYTIEVETGEQMVFILHPGEKAVISGNLTNPMEELVIEGSEDSKRLLELNRTLTRNLTELDGLYRAYQDSAGDTPQMDYMEELNSQAMGIFDKQKEYNRKFIKENPSSLANMIALFQNISYEQPVLDLLEDYELFALVDSALYSLYPESEPVQALHRNVLAAGEYFQRNLLKEETVGVGKTAPEILLPTPEGDTLALSSTRGSIVLLDFWAGWCPPCRQENPNIVRTYNKYKNRGFKVFQVSLDRDRESWLNAIGEDGLGSFIHVSDLKYWESSVVQTYFLESIPASFLLDEEGTIIARNLRGEELGKKLEEIYQNQ